MHLSLPKHVHSRKQVMPTRNAADTDASPSRVDSEQKDVTVSEQGVKPMSAEHNELVARRIGEELFN
jgi:hypothetical protein